MKNYTLILAVLMLAIVGCQNSETPTPTHQTVAQIPGNAPSVRQSAAFYAHLAFQHAPVHYQDVDRTGSHGLSGKADYITAVDFDGDLNSSNNWNNIANNAYKAQAHAYYSVVETSTHYFIIYAFFHPRDWTDNWFLYRFDEHENDLEGLLTIVKKDGSTYGKAEGAITVFHRDFYSYKAPGSSLTNGDEDIDGTFTTQYYGGVYRFKTSQEAKGHGLKAHAKQKPGGSDYVVYYPSKTTSEVPDDIYDRHVKYKLVNMFGADGLWTNRFNTAFLTNAKSFPSTYGNGSANAPWNWDDHNDGGGQGLLHGGMAYYPAELVAAYFNGLGSFSKQYIYNPYLGIE
ncbi:hypothetical protein [Microscilla marina]|nr:hypothetical protein [Microscilla marina]